jgi:ubiquitin C-terminal hydrolase
MSGSDYDTDNSNEANAGDREEAGFGDTDFPCDTSKSGAHAVVSEEYLAMSDSTDPSCVIFSPKKLSTTPVNSSSDESSAPPISSRATPDISFLIEQYCGKIDGYVYEKHFSDTILCCNEICANLFVLNSNADVVYPDAFSYFQRLYDPKSIPFLAFPYIDLNHEVQLLDRCSRLCHAEVYNDICNYQRRCAQSISTVLGARLLALLQEYDLVSRCVEADSTYLAESIASDPPYEAIISLHSRAPSPVPMQSRNLGAKRVSFSEFDDPPAVAGPVAPASFYQNTVTEFKDEHPDRCCALLWGLKSDKLNQFQTCRCSELAVLKSRLCERHLRTPKLELLGTVPLQSFEHLDQHRSRMDALKVMFSSSLSPDPQLYLKAVMKRLNMIIDRCRAMLSCSQRLLKTHNKYYAPHDLSNFHQDMCDKFSCFGKFASALFFRLSSRTPDPLLFVSGEHGCALSFIAEPCKTFFFEGLREHNLVNMNCIFTSICRFTVVSCRNLVDRFRNCPSSPNPMSAQAIFQSLDKLSGFIKSMCLLWSDFSKKWPQLNFPFDLFSSSMFLSSLLLYSPFSLPRVLASLDLLHAVAALINCCSNRSGTSALSIEFNQFIASIQKQKFTSIEESTVALSIFDSFLSTVSSTEQCRVVDGVCPTAVAGSLCDEVLNFLNSFQMHNESASGICALLHNPKCWSRREESCRILVTFLAGSHESFNIDNILSILPWENRYDEDWVEVESLALQSMVQAAEARPSHLRGDFLEISMKKILSCARITADNRRSMCEVAIELLKVLACDRFPSTMFRNVLAQVDEELFSEGTPPNIDGMKLFLQIVDIIVNKFPDLIQEVTERWMLVLQKSESRFSVVSSAILLSSILRLRSAHVNKTLFSVDLVLPKISQILRDTNENIFFNSEDSVIHMLTLCRNIFVVRSTMPSVEQIKQLHAILSSSTPKIQDALFSTTLSPAIFYRALSQRMSLSDPSQSFIPIQASLKTAFEHLLQLPMPDRFTYLQKFINDFCFNAVAALQAPVLESGISPELSNLFLLQLCSWPANVSVSKAPHQIDTVPSACQAGLLCLSSLVLPNCPVFFGRSPTEKTFMVYGGDMPPSPNAYGNIVALPDVSLNLTFLSTEAVLCQGYDLKLSLVSGLTKFIEVQTCSPHFHSCRVQTSDMSLGPFHFRSLSDLHQFRSEVLAAVEYSESAQQFHKSCADWQRSNNPDPTAEADIFSQLINHAKADHTILRFLSTVFAMIFSSHRVQTPLLSDALKKFSQLLSGNDNDIEIVFLIIRQALQMFPSVWSFGFSCLLSNPYVQEIPGYYSQGTCTHYNPPSFKYFHASQMFKTLHRSPHWVTEYVADISGETFFSCVDLVPETGMPKVSNIHNRDVLCMSGCQLNDFKKAEKLKSIHPCFRQLMVPLSDTGFGKELQRCALRLIFRSWSDAKSCSNPGLFDLAADIIALLPASRSLDRVAPITLDPKISEASIRCDICAILKDLESCVEDESLLAPAIQSVSIFERAIFRNIEKDSWPLRKFEFTQSQNDARTRAEKLIPPFILKCIDIIGRQSHMHSKYILSGVSTSLRLLLASTLSFFYDPGIKQVLMAVLRIFANPNRPSAIEVPCLNSYPSAGYIRHDIICNYVDCVASFLRSKSQTLFADLLDLIGPLFQAKIFPKIDFACDSDLALDSAGCVVAESDGSLWLTSEEMFTLCLRLAHLSNQYPLLLHAAGSHNSSIVQCAYVSAALMHLCARAGIGCTSHAAAITGLLSKIIQNCASTTAGHASAQTSARLTPRAKEFLDHCHMSDPTKHVIPLLVDTVMSNFCCISLEEDFRESSLGECFEILRVVLYIIQDQRERSDFGSTFQEENVLKSFMKSLDLLTALFDSKTSRGSMISTKVCEHLLKVITSFDGLLSPRIFVEKLFLIHEIAEQRRSQLALPVKNVLVTIQDSKKHTIERVIEAHNCSSCNIEVKYADMCTRCNRCHSCSSSEPQCLQLRQAHGWSGLTNIGNTCFMNAVLQQLAAIPWVVNSVLFAKPKPVSASSQAGSDVSSASSPPQSASPSLLVEFQKLVAEMLYSNSGVVGTREFAGASKFEGEPLVIGQQQDAGSYFRSFIDQIEGDLNDAKRQEWRNLFLGSIQTQTVRKCHHDDQGQYVTSKSEDVFGELLLSVTGKKNLQECIAARLSSGERQVHCEHCAKPTTASTQDFFLKLPPILICQFHRASADGTKCLDRPSFPFQSTLNLSSYMSPESPQQSCYYELQGIVLHKGESVRSGHYISIIRERATHPCSRLGAAVDRDPQWWMMNDETVSAVTRENLLELCSFEGLPCSDVHEALPYLLVFTRKHTRGPSAPRSFSSALTRMPAGIRDTSLPFDIFDSETPGAETPNAGGGSLPSDGTPLTRRKSEGTGAYVKGENFVARLDTVLQHSEGRVPLLSDGSQFVFQNILKRHDARVQSILLCHSYSNLIERMLKRLHEKQVVNHREKKVGDHVVSDYNTRLDHAEVYEVAQVISHDYLLCRPLSGGPPREILKWDLQIVPKAAPIEDVRAVHGSMHVCTFLLFADASRRFFAWALHTSRALFLIT